jgi:hypothetical protein
LITDESVIRASFENNPWQKKPLFKKIGIRYSIVGKACFYVTLAAAVAALRAAIFDRRFIDGVFVFSCYYIFFVKN